MNRMSTYDLARMCHISNAWMIHLEKTSNCDRLPRIFFEDLAKALDTGFYDLLILAGYFHPDIGSWPISSDFDSDS